MKKNRLQVYTLLSEKKKMALNLSAAVIALGFHLSINFFLSPYIVSTIGAEANGFISIANNFITYLALVTTALNSMSSRFIVVAFYQNDTKLASKYYTSTFLGNCGIVLMLSIPAMWFIAHLEQLLNISNTLVLDVKYLFLLMFLNFVITTLFSVCGTAPYVVNMPFMSSAISLMAYAIRLVVLVVLFVWLKPAVLFLGISTLAATIVSVLLNYLCKCWLTPQFKINLQLFDWACIRNLTTSGIWNSINQGGQILLSGFDLLIANLFLGPVEMGVLSIAKTIPLVITTFAATVANIFIPNLTIQYAKGNKDALLRYLRHGMKLTGILITIPLAVLFVYGQEFYTLWVPSQDAARLQLLSILTCFCMVFMAGSQCLFSVFAIVNKVRKQAVLMCLGGVLNTIIVLALLKTTYLGLLAIAGVSTLLNIIRNLGYTVPFTAKYLGLKWSAFYPTVIQSCCSVAAITAVGIAIRYILPADTWIQLTLSIAIMACAGLLFNLFAVLSQQEREQIHAIVKVKLQKFKQ